MHCPNCGATEQARARVCQSCGTAYASEDLLELRQLEFLLEQTAAWPQAEGRRQPYGERLAVLKARILPAPGAPVPATPIAAPVLAAAATASAPIAATATTIRAAIGPAPAQPPAPP